ncbi:hypothetical protein EVAR_98250_1 [Eumeta japonica]|uniref:Uncharacterized protein n=1 Tax=Eumeta variegata TaxID=151549 RepID=A0A4C1XZY9_EUMVA|nr:hypothetical protein EVAR_98250_1 [Eumeta japonica]
MFPPKRPAGSSGVSGVHCPCEEKLFERSRGKLCDSGRTEIIVEATLITSRFEDADREPPGTRRTVQRCVSWGISAPAKTAERRPIIGLRNETQSDAAPTYPVSGRRGGPIAIRATSQAVANSRPESASYAGRVA